MKRVYISGGITGIPDYMEKFQKIEDRLQRAGYEVVNPAKVMSYLPETFTWDQYMIVALSMLRCCDCIYMMKGWKDSKGAVEEKKYADMFHIKEVKLLY